MKICFMENLLNCGVNKSKINDPIRLILFSYFQPKFWKILLEILCLSSFSTNFLNYKMNLHVSTFHVSVIK